jgi:hypothetical protein
MNRSPGVSTEQTYYNNKTRKFWIIVLTLFGVIVLLASLFFITIISRTLKSGMDAVLYKGESNHFGLF